MSERLRGLIRDWRFWALAALIIFTAGLGALFLFSDGEVENTVKKIGASPAEQAGRELANGNCSGTGPVTLTHSPMRPEDFSIYIPYGLMVGGHVTPIDHAYFAPRDYRSPRDAYPVYTMADGHLVEIQARSKPGVPDEYRLVFSHTCTFLTYYDLVTSLAPEIMKEFEATRRGPYANNLDIPIKAGQLIGRIGGQTLDFAVWNTEQPLKGFINPESYRGEAWKIYTADPYPYLTPELRQLLTERNPRTEPPIAGRIDYDQDGRLSGNWFLEGTTYQNDRQGAEGYWRGHLSFAPNHFDPSAWMVSLGDWQGSELQAAVRGNVPDPSTVSVVSGPVKYELVNFTYTTATGAPWDGMTLIKGPKLREGSQVMGTVLVQLVEDRKLRVETFLGKRASQVSGFTPAAKIYTR